MMRTILVSVAAGFVGVLAEAWAFMVLVGVIHGEWLTSMPTISYGSALKVALAASLVTVVVGVSYGAMKAAVDE